MIFSEPRFLLFFALVFAAHWALPKNGPRKLLLLAASLYFYGCWDPRFLLLIVGCATVDFVAARKIAAARARGERGTRWLLASLSYDLGTLAFFKYCNFFLDSGTSLLTWLGLPISEVTLSIVLPVGISFFTFQAMSYTIDVWRGQLQPVRSYPDFLLFVTFFPQLVAGPIVRASQFLPQLRDTRRFAAVDVQRAVSQFLSGFVKKAVVADHIAVPVDAVFAAPADYSAASIWIAVLGYAVQIYCDFSGYSDMAIGAARLLGYELCENFRAPYLAADISEFWRRWHISLSSWLRDYLYISLGGNRGGKALVMRNLMLTMLLGGLWHGAGWNFVVWGGIHGLALIVHKEWHARAGAGRLPILGRLLTLYVVLLAWIFFRATSFADAWLMCKAWLFAGATGGKQLTLWPVVAGLDLVPQALLLFGTLTACHVLVNCRAHLWLRERLPTWSVSLLFGAVAAAALALMPTGARPFIYFQF